MNFTVKNKVVADKIQRKRGVQRSTARVWASTLRRIHRDYGKGPWSSDLKWLNDPSILDKLKKVSGINIKRNLGNAAAVGLDILEKKTLKAKYDAWLRILRGQADEASKKQEMSTRQKANLLQWKDVIKLKKQLARNVRLKRLYEKQKLSSKEFTELQRNLVLHLYVDMNPIRLDFANVQLIPEEQFSKMSKKNQSKNYLVMARGKWKFYFYQFKSSRYHDLPVVLPVPRSVVLLMKKHLRVIKRRYKEPLWLLWNSKGARMTRNSLSKFLTKTFVDTYNKKVSASMLRTIFLSHKYKHVDILEQESTADSMMHKRTTQQRHYVKKSDS